MRRRSVNKGRSSRSFNRNSNKSHSFNFRIMRGGWRL